MNIKEAWDSFFPSQTSYYVDHCSLEFDATQQLILQTLQSGYTIGRGVQFVEPCVPGPVPPILYGWVADIFNVVKENQWTIPGLSFRFRLSGRLSNLRMSVREIQGADFIIKTTGRQIDPNTKATLDFAGFDAFVIDGTWVQFHEFNLDINVWEFSAENFDEWIQLGLPQRNQVCEWLLCEGINKTNRLQNAEHALFLIRNRFIRNYHSLFRTDWVPLPSVLRPIILDYSFPHSRLSQNVS